MRRADRGLAGQNVARARQPNAAQTGTDLERADLRPAGRRNRELRRPEPRASRLWGPTVAEAAAGSPPRHAAGQERQLQGSTERHAGFAYEGRHLRLSRRLQSATSQPESPSQLN